MLAHQAALSFDIWFGVCPNIDIVIDDLKSLKQ
jgi:shikimate 5-dehydrogenase